MEIILITGTGEKIIPPNIVSQSTTIQNLIKNLPNEQIKIEWDVNPDLVEVIFSIMLGSAETNDPKVLIETIRLSSYLDYKLKNNLHLYLANSLFQTKIFWFIQNYVDEFRLLNNLTLDDIAQIIRHISLDNSIIKDLLASLFVDKTRAEMFSILDKDEFTFRKRSVNRTIFHPNRIKNLSQFKKSHVQLI